MGKDAGSKSMSGAGAALGRGQWDDGSAHAAAGAALARGSRTRRRQQAQARSTLGRRASTGTGTGTGTGWRRARWQQRAGTLRALAAQAWSLKNWVFVHRRSTHGLVVGRACSSAASCRAPPRLRVPAVSHTCDVRRATCGMRHASPRPPPRNDELRHAPVGYDRAGAARGQSLLPAMPGRYAGTWAALLVRRACLRRRGWVVGEQSGCACGQPAQACEGAVAAWSRGRHAHERACLRALVTPCEAAACVCRLPRRRLCLVERPAWQLPVYTPVAAAVDM